VIFTVPGTPAPQGSMRPVVSRSTGKPFLKSNESGGYLRYRADVRSKAEAAWGSDPMLLGPVHLTLVFVFPRPESHWLPVNSKRAMAVLRDDAPTHHYGKPDADKLARSVMDSLTGIVYKDDAQVAALSAVKTYASNYGDRGLTTIVIADIAEE